MDNKSMGRLICQRRKEMNLTQKQLAEKLNVTDKAVSKWETGKGAPDISLLTVLAKQLDLSVIELLDGEYSKNDNFEQQAEKTVIETLQKAKKARIKTATAILSVLIIVFAAINIVAYAYWGTRHKVLYDVDTIFVHQREDNENLYDIYYNCSVKNWWFDFNKYTYNLVAELGGEPGGWYFKTEPNSVTSVNLHENNFVIHVEFDSSTVTGDIPDFDEIITISKFTAYNNNIIDDRANLYMNDFNNIEIIII